MSCDSVQVLFVLYFYRVEDASEPRDSDYMHVCTFACALHSAHMSSSNMYTQKILPEMLSM